ncbi:hypothetical protein BJV82DRAFT_558852 [Fennellomyces sp. T-0311]|nr:hypothetical protein BJV82DRAFT_558852 [Fennellomyces sp. T-0311]
MCKKRVCKERGSTVHHWSAHNLLPDTLLHVMLPKLTRRGKHSWTTLKSSNRIWTTLARPRSETADKELKAAIQTYLQDQHELRCSRRGSKLLNACRKKLGIAPILWLPVSPAEPMRCIRYRLGWLPSGKPTPCSRCHHLSGMNRQHLIACFSIHSTLNLPHDIDDPISYLLNRLPNKPPRSQAARNYWKSKWPQLCAILETLNKHCNPDRRQGYVPPD